METFFETILRRKILKRGSKATQTSNIQMKLLAFFKSSAVRLIAAGALIGLACVAKAESGSHANDAADRAFAMATNYAAMGFYITPAKEGTAGFGVTYEFELPVSRGVDYVFIVAGDRFCEDIALYIESEESGNTIVKDTRRLHNGVSGTRWRSDYSGVVNVAIFFARTYDRCRWCSLVGRRETLRTSLGPGISTVPGQTRTLPSGASVK